MIRAFGPSNRGGLRQKVGAFSAESVCTTRVITYVAWNNWLTQLCFFFLLYFKFYILNLKWPEDLWIHSEIAIAKNHKGYFIICWLHVKFYTGTTSTLINRKEKWNLSITNYRSHERHIWYLCIYIFFNFFLLLTKVVISLQIHYR